MGVWHWMYEHPGATPAELREATMAIARDVWNAYYAPIIGKRDRVLLGIYSHMVSRNLYLPDYPIGSLIAVQLEEQMAKTGDLGAEFTRMAVFGRVVPDLWMENATGSAVGPDALLAATARALEQIGE
jgi:oligoendopeptidase F